LASARHSPKLDTSQFDQAFELLAIRREKLGLEPGEAAPKAGKSGRKVAATTTRVVKRGATRKKK
jgi:DNA topoisomerase-1